jgi:hypothetical protein
VSVLGERQRYSDDRGSLPVRGEHRAVTANANIAIGLGTAGPAAVFERLPLPVAYGSALA